MAAVSDSIVCEYFELHGFLVRQYRKHVAPAGREEDDLDFLVSNPAYQPPGTALPFLLTSEDLPHLERAVVILKPWHNEVFSPAFLQTHPELFRFLQKKAFQQALREFGRRGPCLKLLVAPALPQDPQLRNQSLEVIRSHGLDAVLLFRTCLADLVNRVEPNRNYQKSDLLQTLRVLKNYGFLKEPQMELFKARRKKD